MTEKEWAEYIAEKKPKIYYDFTPLTAEQVWISQILHGARVRVDEEGCAAAAYTIEALTGEAPLAELPEEIEFTLDRPFLFAILNPDGLPLFLGIVRHPAA